MSDDAITSLQERLSQLEREKNLLIEIDRVRDTESEPSGMMSAIAVLLEKSFAADLCVLAVPEPDKHVLDIYSSSPSDPRMKHSTPASLEELARRTERVDDLVLRQGAEFKVALGLKQQPPDGQFLAIAVALGGENLGVVMLVRDRNAFSERDINLLKTAETQLDSAIKQCQMIHLLQQRTKELETIYRIDHIRDHQYPFKGMLRQVLDELCAVVHAEMGFFMLYDHEVERLNLEALHLQKDIEQLDEHFVIGDKVAHEAMRRGQFICRNDIEGDVHSIMCIPLILQDEIIGVIGLANRYAHRFTSHDQRLMKAIGSQIDTAIFERIEQRQLRLVLNRSVDPKVLKRALAHRNASLLKGERLTISVLYADVRGSTSLAERTEPELLVGFINDYLSRMSEVVFKHEGMIDKFVGDEVMALFGAPLPQEDHALRAIHAGVEMQQTHQSVMADWKKKGVDSAPIGVGVATGELIVGEIGSTHRTDYTAMGRAANLGARICSSANAGEVLVSEETFQQAEKWGVIASPISGLELKGIGDDITVYRVTDATASLNSRKLSDAALASEGGAHENGT